MSLKVKDENDARTLTAGSPIIFGLISSSIARDINFNFKTFSLTFFWKIFLNKTKQRKRVFKHPLKLDLISKYFGKYIYFFYITVNH